MTDRFDRRQALRWIAAGALGTISAGCADGSAQGRSPLHPTTSEAQAPPAHRVAINSTSSTTTQPGPPPMDPQQIAARFAGRTPTQWGTDVTGVATRLETAEPVMALSFDACGGPHGSGVDQGLIDLLVREQLPATLFLNERWIDANPAVTEALIGNPQFEIANHGTRHQPLSVTGRSAYGIAGCSSPAQVVDEVESNHARLTALLGHPPRFFRSGTAYYDEVGAAIVSALDETPVSFAVNGDAGATFTVAEIGRALTNPPPGAIVLMHMNKPTHATARGLAAALPGLRARGTRFVTLSGSDLPVVHT